MSGVEGGGGGKGTDLKVGFLGVKTDGFEDALASIWVIVRGGVEGLAGGSTCWVVELKYRARHGRRNVGGSVEEGIRVSRTDLLSVLLSILRDGRSLSATNALRLNVCNHSKLLVKHLILC